MAEHDAGYKLLEFQSSVERMMALRILARTLAEVFH